MMDSTERHGELVAHRAAERTRLREAQVMWIGGFAPADEAGVGGDEPQVLPVAVAPGLGDRQGALVDAAGLITFGNVRLLGWRRGGWLDCRDGGNCGFLEHGRLLGDDQLQKRCRSLLE